MGSLATAWSLLRDPVTSEKRELLDDRWENLPASVKVTTQGLGQKATGCAATIGAQPRCDFSCTGCYLGSEANKIPALTVEQVFRQLDRIREHLGPKSNLQLTDGEVTLRPVEELISILSYAKSIGTIPMLMTHGDTFRKNPGLLERLMVEGGLTEVSIHVDITQRGRLGYKTPKSELELMPLREEFADMIRKARRTTGRTLRAATTMTITNDNLPWVSDVCKWVIENRDAFSLISFQPLAQVGRTRSHLEGVTPDELWTEIAKASPEPEHLATSPLHFGHPDCTRFAPVLVIEQNSNRQMLQLIRNDPNDIRIMEEYTRTGLLGVAFRDDSPLEMVGRAVGMLLTAGPWLFGTARRWVTGRLKEATGVGFFNALFRGLTGRLRISSVTFTSHHFMDPSQLVTDNGKERVDSCVFKVPINGKMVSMCQVNAGGVRESFYESIQAERPVA